MHIFTFEINGDYFGIPIENVAFIEGRWDTDAGMPGALGYIKEIILIHDMAVPIYDLASQFGYTELKMEYVIVLNIENMKLGLALSGVSEVIVVDESTIYPIPAMINTVRHCCKNVVCHREKMIRLINVDKLLLQEEKRELLGMQIMP